MSIATAFDPASFLTATTKAVSEKRDVLPEGPYLALIGEVTAVAWEKGEKSGIRINVPLQVQVPAAIQDSVGRETLTLSDTIFLDLTPEGAIDYAKGKNAKLTKYRDVTGLNNEGEEFSMAMFAGRTVTVLVKHDLYEGEVKERIKGVAAAE